MKNLIGLIMLMLVAFVSMAQTKLTEQTTDGILTAGKLVYIWGTSADTLTNSDNAEYIFRVVGDQTFDIVAQLYSNHVSGTAALSVYTYNSIDGVNWGAKTGDSLTIASVTADGLNATKLIYSDELNPYKKIRIEQTGTAKVIPKLILITRKN
jgi:hypothetical protein